MIEGRRIADRFRILKVLGADGATEVSLAQDEQIGEWVALRILSARFADQWQTLRDACRDARQLAHPQIARVFDFYRDENAAFICREYVEGASIAEFAGRTTAERLGVFAQVASALECAHGLGVVHGDLKGSKILRDVRGDARVIDFRIAAALRDVAPSATSNDHLSPQVRSGDAPVAADDVYALGIAMARAIPRESAPEALGELVRAMSAEPRSARPTDLREIAQTLLALSNDVAGRSAPASVGAAVLRPSAADRPERPPSEPARASASRNLQYAVVAGVLALAAGVVFGVLPRWIDSSGSRVSRVESTPAVAGEVPAPDPEVSGATQSSVESVLARLVPMREQLEAAAVERWAATQYAKERETEARGDAALLERNYAAAQADYEEALVMLGELSDQRGHALADSLEAGAAALEQGNQPRAIEAFDLALAIEPDNADALAGARRAKNLAALVSHVSAAEAFEAQAALADAHREYAGALEIDSRYAPALEGLTRVEAAQAKEDYESNLSLALVSLAKGDLGAARRHFETARALRPDSPEVADGLRQLQQIESSRAIASLRKRAEAAEAAEQWGEAASLYQTIVKTQDNLPFAEEGLQRNRKLAGISEQIAKWLDDPTQLFQRDTLEEAEDLVKRGRSAADGRPKLAEQVRKLEIAVRLASTPISVAFESDAVTEVVIRGVGTLGSFDRRDVPLKPGRYVVIGRRNGYRDARSEISVIPGRQQPVVGIRCTEKI